MRNITEIPPSQDIRPITLRHLRVAAYCRVGGTDQQYRITGAALFTADFSKSQLGKCRHFCRKSYWLKHKRTARVSPDDRTVPQEEN